MERFRSDCYGLLDSFGDARRHTAADAAQLTLKLANPSFARVGANHFPNRIVGKINIAGFETIFRNLPRNQVSLGNRQLLFFDVARQFQNLHSVAQRAWHVIEHVRRGDEQYLS